MIDPRPTPAAADRAAPVVDAYCALVAEAGNVGATAEQIKLVADKFDIEPWILEGYYFEKLDDYEREAVKW